MQWVSSISGRSFSGKAHGLSSLWRFNYYRRIIMDADRAFAASDDPQYPSSPVTLLVRVWRRLHSDEEVAAPNCKSYSHLQGGMTLASNNTLRLRAE